MGSIRKNYTYQVLYEVLVILLPIFTAPYITRTLGADCLGVYTYAVSIVNLFLSIARLGVVSYGSRVIAKCADNREERSKAFWNIYAVQVITSLIVTIAYVFYTLLFVHQDKTVYVILIIMVSSHIFDISWLYMGIENFKKTALRNTIVKIISLVLIFTLVKSRSDLWKYTLIMSGCIVFGHITLWKDFSKHCGWCRPTASIMLRQIKPLLTLFVPTIAVTIYTVISKIILGAISGTTEVSFYEYAAAIVSIPLGFITSFGAVLLPRLSNMVASDAEEQEKRNVSEKSLIFVVFLAFAMAFGLIAVAEELVLIYYGNEFQSCITLMIIMAIKLPFMAWANVVRSTYLIPNNKDKEFIISLFAGAGVSVVVNILLIPRLGSIGAVIASVCAETIVCLIQTVIARKGISLFSTVVKCVPFALVGVFMLICVRWVANLFNGITILGLLTEVCAGAFVYLTLSFVYCSIAIVKMSPVSFAKNMCKKFLTKK